MTVEAITCTSSHQRTSVRQAWRVAVMLLTAEGDAAAIALAWTIVSEMPADSDSLEMSPASLAALAYLSLADADAAMARLERAGLVIRTAVGIHLARRTTEDRA